MKKEEIENTTKIKLSPGRPNRLPLGMFDAENNRWYKGYEVTRMHSDILASFKAEDNPFKLFGSVVAKGLVNIFDLETGDEFAGWKKKTSKISFPDIFFLMTEIIIETKGSSLVPSVYACPLCKKFTKFENPIGEAGGLDEDDGFDLTMGDEEISSLEMEDIRDIPFNAVDLEKPVLSFHFDEGVVVDGERYTEFEFRIPEIGDYILKSGGLSNAAGEKQVLFHCLTSINGLRGKELSVLKATHGVGLLGLSLMDYIQITSELNKIGYDYQNHFVTCAHCSHRFKTVFDLSNFFGSLLSR